MQAAPRACAPRASAAARAGRWRSPSAPRCRPASPARRPRTSWAAGSPHRRRARRSCARSSAQRAPAQQRPLHSSVITSSTPAPAKQTARRSRRAATDHGAPGKLAADIGDRRQRHHRVAEPVGRHAPSEPARGSDIGLRLVERQRSRLGAAPASRSRQRRCIHSHSSGCRRTYISSTSVQRCVNSRIGVGRVRARRLDRMLVDHPVAAVAAAAARTPASPARRCAAPAPPAPTSSPPAGRRSRRRPRPAVDVLIDQQRDAAFAGELAQHLAHRALPVDHRVAGARADALEQRVQRAGCRAAAPAPTSAATRSACAIACISQKPKCR